jgi:hypothetical protein
MTEKQFHIYGRRNELLAIWSGESPEDALDKFRKFEDEQRALKVRLAYKSAEFLARQQERERAVPQELIVREC